MVAGTSKKVPESVSSEYLKTEEAIDFVKDSFSKHLMRALNLVKVSSPLAVLDNTGINDDLNGIEMPVSFLLRGWAARALRWSNRSRNGKEYG